MAYHAAPSPATARKSARNLLSIAILRRFCLSGKTRRPRQARKLLRRGQSRQKNLARKASRWLQSPGRGLIIAGTGPPAGHPGEWSAGLAGEPDSSEDFS